MNNPKSLNDIWLKAAVLGCLWASSEIVLGSFLHNLRIPFTGNILTGIGIILLISVAQIWKDKGLFWRAGLVCALMKSISPSAIIFGPMIAIFSEALLMEFSVRIFKRNIFSFLLAGLLAMSWNLFHVLANNIINYGFNIIDLYVNLTKFAQKQLNIINDNYWMPLLVLFILYMLFGLIAAIFGIYIGKKAAKQPLEINSLTTKQVLEIKSAKTIGTFKYSFIWLLCNIILLITELTFMGFLDWHYWIIFGTSILLIWSFKYRHSLKSLAKPKFWIFFVLITMASGFFLYKLNSTDEGFIKGILIGLEMNFRAAITIVGFSTIGSELRNPGFRKIFANSKMRQLTVALEVAFETLPNVVANLPRLQDVFKKPTKTFHELVSQANFWLEKVEFKIYKRKNVFIISGLEKTGKSTLLKNIIEILKLRNLKIGGFVSPSIWENNTLFGYDLLDVLTNKKLILSRTSGNDKMPKVGSYFFNMDCIVFGEKVIDVKNLEGVDVVVIDEVGPWELKNQGWAKSINKIVKHIEKPMIWVVRESIVDKVVENWSLDNPEIIEVSNNNIEIISSKISKLVNNEKV